MAIQYGFTMPDDTEPNLAKRSFKYQMTGENLIRSIDFTTANATGDFKVPKGSSFDYWATETDQAGNESDPSPLGHVDNASDTTPPQSPGAPTLGKGQEVPD